MALYNAFDSPEFPWRAERVSVAIDLLDGNCCVFGLQWGDEGKGKIVDFLAEQAQVVVRYCGGANAGHTVRIGANKYSTHLLPVGVFRPGVMNLIGNGVVLDPEALFNEIDEFTGRGIAITPENLRISYKTHIVMPWHKMEDAAREQAAGAGGIGTTKRGIGPCYADKMHRTTALRVADLLREEKLKQHIDELVTKRNYYFAQTYQLSPMDAGAIFQQYREYGRRLKPFVDDTGHLLLQALRQKRKIVFEGAHAVLLDVDHGTYPFVTSSNCSALGVYTGAGAPPNSIKNFVGIMKAYSTRVGGGPFPTEQDNAIGDAIRQRGNEYGTTTRRPRRCGWFDAMAVRYAAEMCGVNTIALMLLDVLSGLEEIQVCVGYQRKGKKLDYFRADMDSLAEVEPIYETLSGWSEDISQARDFAQLPAAAQRYVERLEQLAGAPIRLVSVGADRAATLHRD